MANTTSSTAPAFPTKQIIVSGFAAAFVALIVSLIAFVALTDRGISAALSMALGIAGLTAIVTILIQTVIVMMKGRR